MAYDLRSHRLLMRVIVPGKKFLPMEQVPNLTRQFLVTPMTIKPLLYQWMTQLAWEIIMAA